MRDSAGGSWSLWPREHGAYAQLALPLVTALCAQTPTLAALALAACAICAFLAHEPLLVVLGRRGERARRQLRRVALRRLVALSGISAATGLIGLWRGGLGVLAASAAVLAGGAVAGLLIRWKREKTLLGELVVAATLSLAAVPVALAAEATWAVAVINVSVWAAIFALGTLTVHSVLRRAKTGSLRLAWTAALLSLVLLISAGALLASGAAWAAALVPPALASAGTLAWGATPRHLRRIGWSMVAADVLALLTLVALVNERTG